MAYRVTKGKRCIEELELIAENGEVIKTLTVDLGTGKIAESLSYKYIELMRAQSELSKVSESPEKCVEAYEKIGNIIMLMIETVFGTKGAKDIFEFYENDYIEIVKQVMPFITDVVLPNARKIAQENKTQILKKYNRKPSKGIM